MPHQSHILATAIIAIIFALAGCSPASQTSSAEFIATAIAATLNAAEPLNTAVAPPSSTPSTTNNYTTDNYPSDNSPTGNYKTDNYPTNLTGLAFHDLNANGLHDDGEPSLPGIQVCLDEIAPTSCTLTASDGSYTLTGYPPGAHQLYLLSPGDPASAFRYYTTFQRWIDLPLHTYTYLQDSIPRHFNLPAQRLVDATLHDLSTPIHLTLPQTTELPNSITTLDLALTQGFLTDPIACSDRPRLTKFHGYDLDRQAGSVRNYLGDTSPLHHGVEGASSGTEDQHIAVDWGSTYQSIRGIYVRAAAPGLVDYAGDYQTPHGNCLLVKLGHPGLGAMTSYVHLDTLLVDTNQPVYRGQIIGTLGQSCTSWPHLHFFLQSGWDYQTNQFLEHDPYRDTLDPLSYTWWTKDNQPICLP